MANSHDHELILGTTTAEDHQLLQNTVTAKLLEEYRASRVSFGTNDLVCFAARDDAAGTTMAAFSTRETVLGLPAGSHPALERVQDELAVSAHAKARLASAPWHDSAFWLVVGTPTETDPLIAVVGDFLMQQGGSA